jgi:hypothetical protein
VRQGAAALRQLEALELFLLAGFAVARAWRTASLLRLARSFFAACASRRRIFLESLLSKLPIVSSRLITGEFQRVPAERTPYRVLAMIASR